MHDLVEREQMAWAPRSISGGVFVISYLHSTLAELLPPGRE